jgi:glycogen debranching enzyme
MPPPHEPDPHPSLVSLRARPDTLYTSRGRTVLAAGRDGTIAPETNQGLFVHETRLLSRLRYTIDGRPPLPVALSNVEQHTWMGYYIQAAKGGERLDTGSGQVPAAAQDALELRLSRFVGEGLHEDLDLTNHRRSAVRLELTIEVAADFADVLEAGGTRRQKGRRRARWCHSTELELTYTATHRRDGAEERHIARALRLRLSQEPTRRPGHSRVRYHIALARHETWHLCLDFLAEIDGERLPPPQRCRSFSAGGATYDERAAGFAASSTAVRAPPVEALAPSVLAALEQARRDLGALRLYDLDSPDGRAWVPAAGLPQFVALFGRDSLTASWQAALLGPEMMEGVLAQLARTQGTRSDPWRDEEPGRMLHEAHTGPLSALEYVPHGRSYGSMTTSGFYAFLVSQLWHWTGRREQVQPFVEPALAALRWLDRHHRTPQGFYAYATRSPQGVRNQGWKDSEDAIVDADGHSVEPPLATCEEQGFVYVAKLFFSELLGWLHRGDEAKVLRREAADLKARFADAFWMEDERFLAMAVDGRDRPVRGIGSNAGHALAAGIVAREHIPAVADRLLAEDLFSGWGIRTLSTHNPAYNPFSYHRGSVWPVEQGPFALGFMRFGLHGHAERLSRAVFECARLFEAQRLPEVLSGHPRDETHPFPALYPGACAPQAWSASTLFCLLQALLGLYPYAPLNLLVLDPHLPAWLPEVTLAGLRVGDARVDLHFTRRPDGTTRFDVEERKGSLHVVHQPSPWSLTADLGERLRDVMTSVV